VSAEPAEVTGAAYAAQTGETTDGVTITVCPDGPLLVRGSSTLRTADGTLVEHDRPVVALCRCGRSRLKPLCDGSHRLARFRDPATPEQLDHVLRAATPLPVREGSDAGTDQPAPDAA
jgi:CDGSH-type Zn-finger protein